MKIYTIYKIGFPNGECYIGQTSKHEYIRWGQHLEKASTNRHENKKFQVIYDEYGYGEWVFEVLQREDSDDTSYVSLLEQSYVDKHPLCINNSNKATNLSREEVLARANTTTKRWWYERGGKERYEAKNPSTQAITGIEISKPHNGCKKEYHKEYNKKYREYMKNKKL
tara:strand:- start:21 stop:524 length:504 start_codon:yes stop_codon:yes gene_type:complete